jgi:HK97 family phage portal protein
VEGYVSLFFRDRQPVTEQRMTIDALAAIARNSRSYGTYVDQDSAMRHDAVWACVTRIAQDVAMMPVDVVRYQGETRTPVTPPQIITAPSAAIDALDWRYQVMVSLLKAGNAWGTVTATTPDYRYPARIELLNDDQVSVAGGKILVDGEPRDLWPLGDLWHLPAYTMPGSWIGLSPIAYHARSIGTGLAAEQFGSQFFTDGGHPTAIVGIDGVPTEEQALSLKEKLLGITRGNRELIVLPKATTYTQLSVNPSDSQFIDTQRYTVEQICRVYGEDPADYASSAGSAGSITYANRSDADLARFKRRQFWVTKLQGALTAMIPRPQVAKLNTSSTLMMTDRERHEIFGMRLDKKTITVNEVRDLGDEPRFGPEYDEPGIPGVDTPEFPPGGDA